MILPKGWVSCRLADANLIIAGQSPESKYYNENGEGLPFFQGKADFGQLYPTNRVYCTAPKKTAESGDIMLSVRAPVGPTNLARETVAIGRGLNAIRPLGKLSTRYVLYYFKQIEPVFSGSGTGTTFSAVTVDDVKNLVFPLPPIAEQRRIVAKIDALFSELDKGVEMLQTIRQQLQMYRQAVLKWAFEENSEEWSNILLKDLFSTSPQNGLYMPASAYGKGTQIIRIDNFYDGKIITEQPFKRLEIEPNIVETYKLYIDDLLVNRVNSMPYLGKCGLVISLTEDTVFESNIMRIKLDKQKCNPKFVTYYLCSLSGKKELKKNAKQAVNQASINQTDVSNVMLRLPVLEIQSLIVSRIESRLSVCDKLEQIIAESLAKAAALRQSILKKAFAGQLVPQDPNDEPAEKLLERIRAEQAHTAKSKTKGGKKNG